MYEEIPFIYNKFTTNICIAGSCIMQYSSNTISILFKKVYIHIIGHIIVLNKISTQALFLINLLRLSSVFCKLHIFLTKNNTYMLFLYIIISSVALFQFLRYKTRISEYHGMFLSGYRDPTILILHLNNHILKFTDRYPCTRYR